MSHPVQSIKGRLLWPGRGDDSQISNGVSRIVYDFGNVMCHQRPDRSWFVNGNQLPLCIRCMSISFGMVFIFGVAWGKRSV